MLLPKDILAEIVENLPEGIILMDQDRIIYYLNEQAVGMTGWKLGEKVPYCTYCQQREIAADENRCILTSEIQFHSSARTWLFMNVWKNSKCL